jgi:hypothetical protein
MGWARIDDGFHDHPKLIGLPLEAVGLWTLALTWAHRHHGVSFGLFGHLPADLPVRLGGAKGKKLADMLTRHGLWDTEPNLGGWVIHDYIDYLPASEKPTTASEVRKARSEAGKRGAKAKWDKAKAETSDWQDDGNLPEQSHSSANGKTMPPNPNPTRPSFTHLDIEGGGSVTREPEPPLFCKKHPNGHDGPCGACADARRLHAVWLAASEQAKRDTVAASVDAVLRCPNHCINGWIEDADSNPIRKCNHQAA